MSSKPRLLIVALSFFGLSACGGGDVDADADRDVNLPPAESITALGDTALTESESPAEEPDAPPPPPRPVPPPSLDEGTELLLSATDTIELNEDAVGGTVTATLNEGLYDTRGREVIPAGATFYGTLSKTEVTDSTGTFEVMLLNFNQVGIDGTMFAVEARTDSIGTCTATGGMGLDEAAKVGAGAAVGAIAGRLIGGNRTGTLVGAAVGTAAGVGVALATRGQRVILDGGAPIRIVLTSAFVRAG